MDKMLEIFPKLDVLPSDLSVRFRGMIENLDEATQRGSLPVYKREFTIFEIFDSEGHLRCLFKKYEDSARKEVIVYLLDHPSDGHRSASETIYGFGNVIPTIFLRFKNGNEEWMGILMEFVDDLGIQQLVATEALNDEQRLNEDMKMAMVDLRFAITDRKLENMLARYNDHGELRLVPIDHEYSFFDGAGDFTVPGFLWLKDGMVTLFDHVRFSPQVVNYIQNLNPDWDLDFLTTCGSKHGADYAKRFKVFTALLKISVSLDLAVLDICKIAASKLEEQVETYSLQAMADAVERNDDFVVNLRKVMSERLEEYALI